MISGLFLGLNAIGDRLLREPRFGFEGICNVLGVIFASLALIILVVAVTRVIWWLKQPNLTQSAKSDPRLCTKQEANASGAKTVDLHAGPVVVIEQGPDSQNEISEGS